MCLGEAKSEWSGILRGVPQGSILGPLLFILYVNDLPHAINRSTVKQYADDTTMSLASDDVCSLEEGLAGDLEGVTRWVKANKLKLNVKKTQLLLLGRRKGVQRMEQAEIRMDGQVIQRSKEVKCLGVLLDDELKWKEQVLRVRKKGFAELSRLRRLRDMLPPSTKKKLYNALVLPHLDYCSVVWQECTKELRQKKKEGPKLWHAPYLIEATQDSECGTEGGAAVVVTGEEERSVPVGIGT